MLLGEPARTPWDLHFKLLGIPVRVHPFFWVVGIFLGFDGNLPLRDLLIRLLAWSAAWFVAILCHELGHALVMRAHGFSPWITLIGFGGMASYNPGQAWGSRGTGTMAQIQISGAGAGAGFLLAAIVAGAVKLTGNEVVVLYVADFLPYVLVTETIGPAPLQWFINGLLGISVFWGVLNLLPVYPLDGGHIARELLLRANPQQGIRQSLLLSVFTAAALAVIALVQLKSFFMAFMFGYLAYSSYAALQAYSGRRF